jgi:hypothetical protein
MEQAIETAPKGIKCQSSVCDKYFKPGGRADKKFCNDGCRNAYNNSLKKKKVGQVEMINDILEKNHSILQELIGSQSYKYVAERILRDKGFNARYFTHPFESAQKILFSVCYDIAYRKEENGTFKILKEDKPGAFAK